MAGAEPMADEPIGDLNMLPDRYAQVPQMGGPQVHPMLEQVLGRQPKRPDWSELALAFGAGTLATPPGRNLFAGGAQAVAQLMAQQPDQLSALEQLQANNELWELEDRRRQSRTERDMEARRQAALQGIAQDQNQPQWRREQAQYELMGLGDVFEEPKNDVPTKVQEAEVLADRLGIPFEEAAARVGLTEAGAPKVETVGGRDVVWDPERGAYVPAPTAGLPETPEVDVDKLSTRANTLRDDYEKAVTPYSTVLQKYAQVADFDPDAMNGTQDYALMIALGRALSPESTLQLGEAEMLQALAAGQNKFASSFRTVLGRKQLKPQERKDILAELKLMAREASNRVASTAEAYGKRAKAVQVPAGLVVSSYPVVLESGEVVWVEETDE
jgi:hypothetical protein